MTRALAQALRRNMSALELRAWKLLRALRAEGVHVRRQHPIGRCVADFAVLRSRLAIEIDGPLHQQQRDADAERDARFADLGWRVLRVTHKELDDEAGFLAVVRALAAPSPRGEGEGGGAMRERCEDESHPSPRPPPLAGRGSASEPPFPPHLRRRTRANRRRAS